MEEKGLMAKPKAVSTRWFGRRRRRFSSRAFVRFFAFIAIMAVLPPIFFHLRLKRHEQAQSRKCGWLQNPPLVCAHGGDSSSSPPNTVGYIVMKDPINEIQSDLLRMEGAEVIGVYHGLVNEKLVKSAHRAGKKVYAWTVDDIESMQKMLLVGVDSIITSQPNSLQKMMEYIRNQCMGVGF